MKDQDEQLDGLSTILSRQKHIAVAISTELHEQNAILDDLNSDVDRVQGKMGTAKRLMNKLT